MDKKYKPFVINLKDFEEEINITKKLELSDKTDKNDSDKLIVEVNFQVNKFTEAHLLNIKEKSYTSNIIRINDGCINRKISDGDKVNAQMNGSITDTDKSGSIHLKEKTGSVKASAAISDMFKRALTEKCLDDDKFTLGSYEVINKEVTESK